MMVCFMHDDDYFLRQENYTLSYALSKNECYIPFFRLKTFPN